jgi:phosphoribosyl 1,2-cyclic phosphate phosphodiesterase
VYGNLLSLNGIKQEIPYAFEAVRYPGVPAIELHEISLEPFCIGDITITPIEVWHHKMRVYGFRFGNFTYITDANRIVAEEREKISGSKIIVLNALRHERHISHFSLGEAIEVVKELKVPEAYFTHISHQLGLHQSITDGLPKGIHLAHDGLRLSV